MRNLCEQLEVIRCAHVREHSCAPKVRVTKVGGEPFVAELQDVGADYIEVGHTGLANRQLISRAALAEVVDVQQ